MSNDKTAPAGELTDESIYDCLPLGVAELSVVCGPSEIRTFARAVIAADRALRASPAAGDVAMPVVSWASMDGDSTTARSVEKHEALARRYTDPLVKQSDAQAALAATNDMYLRLCDAAGYTSGKDGMEFSPEEFMAAQHAALAAMTAERDHWKANHDAQVQRARLLVERTDMPVERVKAYELVTALTAERDALRKDTVQRRRMTGAEITKMLDRICVYTGDREAAVIQATEKWHKIQ